MRFLTRSMIAVFLAAVALGLLAMAGDMVRDTLAERAQQAERPRVTRERVFTARVVALQPGEVAPVLSAFGEVISRRTLELGAPSAARILELADGFEEGAQVQAGQVLIRLDPADAIATRDLARNDLTRAEAELRDAQRSLDLSRLDRAEAEAQADLRRRAFERRESLTERGVATETMVEEAELAYANARAAVIARRQAEAQAEARVSQAQTALERQRINMAEAERRVAETELSTTFGGVLSDTAAVVGGHVGMNERLARVIDPDALEVAFRLSTAQYLRLLDEAGDLIRADAEIALELGGLEVTSPGRVSRASPSVGEGQSGRLVHADIHAPRGFRPGDFVVVRITEPVLPDVALIPATAVDAEGVVLVLGDEERLVAATVEILRRQGDSVLVRVPPQLNGREIVAARSPLLGEGIRVRPQREENAQIPEAPAMVALDPDTRAQLIAQVEAATMMPDPVRTRILSQLQQDEVPARLIERLQQGPGGGRSGG
jgi:multidrug efflux pump subunit AcrA (membrane-fusion protein)